MKPWIISTPNVASLWAIINNLKENDMLIYIILGITFLYIVVAYYLCLTAEMPDSVDWEEECECSPMLDWK
jgi:hypothetical protein